jgi:hypothetical protein
MIDKSERDYFDAPMPILPMYRPPDKARNRRIEKDKSEQVFDRKSKARND